MKFNLSVAHVRKNTYWVMLLSTFIGSSVYADSDKPMTVQEKIQAKVLQAEQAQEFDAVTTKSRKDYFLNKEYAINQVLLKEAKDARAKGDFETAKGLYGRVLGFTPNNPYAHAGLTAIEREQGQAKKLETAQKLIDEKAYAKAKALVHDVLLENPHHKKARDLNYLISQNAGDSNARMPTLKAKFDKPVSLELRNANVRLVFDTLTRDTGINFILDKDVKADAKANINVKNLPIEEAIDMVISSNGLDKKVISDNTVVIFPSNKVKKRAYQELLIRNFYLNNTKAKDVAELLKTMIKTKNIYVYERLNMLVMRDSPEVINLAEKLVASIDLEDPEVMMEIEVLEVSHNRAQELGIVFPNQLSVLSPTSALTLQSLKAVNQSTIGVSPNPALNFRKTDGDLNLLSNPRIRVKNNEKAQILVGDKIPVITTTSTANVGISESVTYVDVGLKLEVEPRITLDNFVNIKVGLEVSTLGDKTVTSNGATVYAIGTRNTQTTLRLKDGETQVLAGLILDDDRNTVSKLPGLGDIPLLGRLFSNNDNSKSKTEIVLAITPRILGNIPLPNAEYTEYWSGTANQVSDKIKKTAPVDSGGPTKQPTAFERLLEQRRERQQQMGQAPVVPPIDPAMVPPIPEDMKGDVNLVPPAQQGNGAGLAEQGKQGEGAKPAPKEESFIPGIQVNP